MPLIVAMCVACGVGALCGHSFSDMLAGMLEVGKAFAGKDVDVAQAIDKLCAGLSGTAVAVIGWLLARMGWLRGKKDDEKEENFDKLQGYQDYSLQIGDVSATIDWAAPTALPLFTGAAVAELMEQDDMEFKDAWDAMMMIAEPMLSLSMLSSLNDVISSAAFSNQKLPAVIGSAFQSYLGQAFPTILGQLARSVDGTRRTTYVDKNSKVPSAIQRFVQSSVQAKIPGWESQKVPYIDAWGREDTAGSKLLGAFENFFSPAYVNMVKTTDVDEELLRLYDVVQDTSVLPAAPSKKIGQHDLTADEYVRFAKDAGSTKYTLLTQLLFDPRYMALTDEQKAAAIEKIYKYANTAAAYHTLPDYDIRKQAVWIAEAEAMGSDRDRLNRIWEAIENALK